MAIRKAIMLGNGKNKGKCENSAANVRFVEIADDSPRNTAISTAQMETVSDANEANCADREVLISKTISGRTDGGGAQIMMIVRVLLIQVLTGRIL